jgi:hypothetical protein
MLKKILLVVAIIALAWIALGLVGTVFKLGFVLVRLAAGIGLIVLIVWLIKTQLTSSGSGPRSRF